MKNHETNLEPWKTNLEPWKICLELWKIIKTDQESWGTNLEPWTTIKTDLEPWKTNWNCELWNSMQTRLRLVTGDYEWLRWLRWLQETPRRKWWFFVTNRRWISELSAPEMPNFEAGNSEYVVHPNCLPFLFSFFCVFIWPSIGFKCCLEYFVLYMCKRCWYDLQLVPNVV